MSILDDILAARRARIGREGHAFGHPVPAKREVPLVPFARARASTEGALICEVKRRSPSKGAIDEGLDAVAQAGRYAAAGALTVSVLTEEERFGGSLDDLMAIKRTYPELAVLRKDFLIDLEDVDISFRAGADAILLIAAALAPERLASLYHRAEALGMSCLVEVHAPAEAAAIASLAPAVTGINARDLGSFVVDPIVPLATKPFITWPTRLIYESGISSEEEAAFARASGFDGVLVGESVVRRPELIPRLFVGLGRPQARFWERLYARRAEEARSVRLATATPAHQLPAALGVSSAPTADPASARPPHRPLVKICGLCREEDVHLADSLGADILGFIFAPSKRRADPDLLRRLGATRALRVGVVVLERGAKRLPEEVRSLLDAGLLDAVQLHGDEGPEDCFSIAFPYYKALQLAEERDAERIESYRCPRLLVDAFSTETRGGTGSRLAPGIARAAGRRRPLWLAGGLGPDNVREIIGEHHPELIDASSRLEAEPGRKDHEKLRAFFREVEAACGEERADFEAAGVALPQPAGSVAVGRAVASAAAAGPAASKRREEQSK